MKQIVQPLAGGAVEVLDVPRPVPGPTEVLVRTVASVISPGTERAVTALAQSSLLAKARARPDLVRQVVRKARTDGFAATRPDGAQPAGRGPAARLLRGGHRAGGGRRRDRGPAGAAGGDRRGGPREPRGVPGRARAAVRPRSRGSPGRGRGVRHDRRHRPARPADRRGGPRGPRSWCWGWA